MANRKSINIDIKFPSKSEANKQLSELLLDLGKVNQGLKIDLDMSNATKTFKDFSNMLDKVGKQLSTFGAWDKFFTGGVITEEIKNTNKLAEAMGNLNDKSQIAKKERDKIWQNKNADASNKALDDEYNKSLQLEKSINAMQEKLNVSKSNSFIDSSVFDNLQTKINSINTNTPENELIQLKQEIKNLSSSDNSIVRLQNAINKYGISIDALKGKYEGLVPDKELSELQSQLNKLKSIMDNINKGDIIDSKKITSELNSTSNAFKKLETDTKNSSEALRLAQKDSVTFSGAIKDITTKVGLFSVIYTAINAMERAFKDGIQSVIDMDTALYDLLKVVNLSDAQLGQMRDTAVSLGKELGTSSISIAQAMAEFGRQYKDTQTISEMTRTSVMGSNVMGISSAEVAKGLTTTINSMKMEAKDSMVILDSMNEIQNNYRVGADSLLSALSEVGSVAYTSGASLEKVEGYITAISVATGETGDEVGNALRSVMSRVYKLGAEGLEGEGKPEKMLQSIGVAVRDAKGEFRDFPSILDDLNVKWKNMSNTEKIATAQTVGGIHRYNEFMSLMNNYGMAIDSTTTAMNSQGSATKENEIYMQSAEAKLGSLKATMEEFMFSFINSDALKGGISLLQGLAEGLNKLQGTFGSLGVTVGTLSSIFLMFTNNPLKKFASDLVKTGDITELFATSGVNFKKVLSEMNLEMMKTGSVTSTAQVGIKALGVAFNTAGIQAFILQVKTIALQAVLSMGLSLAISAVVGVLSTLISDLKSTGNSMETVTEKTNQLKEATENVAKTDTLLSEYKNLTEELGNANLKVEERKGIIEKIQEIKNNLYGVDERIQGVLENSNLSLETQLSLVQQIVKERQKDKADETEKELTKGTFINPKGNKEDKTRDLLPELQNEILKYKDIIEKQKEAQGGNIRVGFDSMNLEEQTQELATLKDSISSTYLSIEEYNSSVQSVIDTNGKCAVSLIDVNDASRLVDGGIKNFIISLLNVDSKTEETSDKVATMGDRINKQPLDIKTQAIKNSLESLGLTAEDVDKKMKEITTSGFDSPIMLETATKSFADTTDEIDTLYGMIDKINEAGSMTPQIMSEIAGKYNDVGSAVFNTSTAQEFLNDKIAEMESTQSEAMQVMRGNDVSYYNELLSNGDSLQQSFDALASNYVDTQSSAYDYDVKEYGTLNEAKEGMTQQLSKVLAQSIANFTNGNATEYEKDLSSFTTLAQMKVYTVQKLDDQIAKVQTNYDSLITRTKSIKSLSSVASKSMSADIAKRLGLDSTNDLLSNVTNELDNLKSERLRVETSFSEFNRSFSKSTPNFSGADYKNGSSSDKGSSSGKSATEKQVEDIENLADRYYDLNEKLKSVEIAFKKIDTIMENGTDEQKIKSLKEQVALYNKKRAVLQDFLKEQQKESSSDRDTLGKVGFKFNADGSINNYAEKMKALQQWANSRSNPDDKQSAQDYYKEMSKLTEEYFDLIKDKIPDTQNQIENIKNEVISAQKEVADILKEQRDKYIDNLEKETDKLKTELEKRKTMMEKSWEEEDNQDELSEKQKKLSQLEADLSSALRSGDESLAYSIRQQIAEAQKEMNDFINKSERDKASDMFDEEEKRIDEELQAKIDMIESQLGDEDILKLVQQGVTDLSATLNSIDSTTNGVNRSFMLVGDTVTNIGTTIATTWSSGLDKIIEKVQKLVSIFPNSFSADIDVNKNSIASKQNNNGQGNTIIINPGEIVINGANKNDIRKEIDEMGDKIFDQVINALDH